jgi:hypothetical protein
MPDLLVPAGFGTEAMATPVQNVMRDRNSAKRRPLTPYEKRQLDDGALNPIYLYNVSPIHEWSRPQGQLGVIIIQKREWKAVVSLPRTIPGAIVRWVQKGLMVDPFIEGGMDIAIDVCGSGPGMDGTHPNANLTRYGVFISEKAFEQDHLPIQRRAQLSKLTNKTAIDQMLSEWLVPKPEQKRILAEANEKLLMSLQERILEADNWHQGGPEQRKFIGPWHRENLRAFNEITGRKESRPWSTITMGETLVACEVCGTMVKPGLLKCPNCLEILDVAGYKKRQAELGH